LRLLFVHGIRLKECRDGNYYTHPSYNMGVWSRYLCLADELTIVASKESKVYDSEYAKAHFSYLDRESINVILVPDLTSSYGSFLSVARRKVRKKAIREAVLRSDRVIARVPSDNSNVAIKYARKLNKPYLVEVVGCPWDALWNHSIKGKIIAPLMFLATKRVVRQSEYALYVTNEFLQRRYPCDGVNIGCSDVALPQLDEGVLLKRLEKIRNLSNEKPIIIGTIAAVDVRFKGHEYVIKAISRLNKQGYKFEYHLAGDGDDSYLKLVAEEQGVGDEVKFLGPLPHEEVFQYLDNVDIYIQPSKQEGLPRALVEAMSRGCPALGSKTGGIPELLNKDFIFQKGAVDEICALLERLDKETMYEEAIRNFEKAKEFDRDLLERRRTAFYKLFTRQSI